MRWIAIRAAMLFDGTGLVRDPLVLVGDGRIAEIVSGPRAVAPPDAELVDLPGATLLPGLVDTHECPPGVVMGGPAARIVGSGPGTAPSRNFSAR
ncbi:hypothetical protein K1T35_12530 [Pseudonocardia sp. DSM 110487]|uniref:hypothetical protein n=1 Tax=Pseudonocardia sp. DSM 110487 TaxID=2865833 RepID=UPI001C6A77B4|nr:hypothetical protein [Pseudonocardia sp. DSM 110487]QYN37986.1 hypothetical protein K1T35_12530 [Pseudonocardia sp. DSM 110487]